MRPNIRTPKEQAAVEEAGIMAKDFFVRWRTTFAEAHEFTLVARSLHVPDGSRDMIVTTEPNLLDAVPIIAMRPVLDNDNARKSAEGFFAEYREKFDHQYHYTFVARARNRKIVPHNDMVVSTEENPEEAIVVLRNHTALRVR